MIVNKTPQNIYKICFQAIWMTFICDLGIDRIMFEPHHRSTSEKKNPVRKSRFLDEGARIKGFIVNR